ncbi:MAG: AAA family ATPase [Blastocatellia bacterium]
MLRSLTIKNFRGFRELKIESLARVNLIAGKNNVGKTGVLEALYLLYADEKQLADFPSAFRNSPEPVVNGSDSRQWEDNFASFWEWLPFQKTPPILIESQGEISWGRQVLLENLGSNGANKEMAFHYQLGDGLEFQTAKVSKQKIEIVKNAIQGVFTTESIKVSLTNALAKQAPGICVCSTRYSQPTEDAELLNSVKLKRKKKRLIESLKVVDSRLEDLDYLKIGSEPLVYVDVGLKEMIPMTQLGQGFTRLFRFFAEMLVEEAKIILIDEIENGIHHSALADVWAGIAEIAEKEDLQIFATTHSWECISSAHQSFANASPDDFRLFRLEQVKGEIKTIAYDEEAIEAALKFEMEVR